MSYTTNMPCEAILAADVQIAEFGKTVGANAIGPSACPESPTSSTPGPWHTIGEIKNAKIQTTYKTAKVEGAKNGKYRNREMRIVDDRKLTFQTHDLSIEALRVTFGLLADPSSADATQPFISSADQIECWMYIKLADAYRNGADLTEMRIPGKLRLANPLNIASDPVLCDWEFVIDTANPLSSHKALGIKSVG